MCIDARVAFFPSLAQRFVTYRSAGGQGSAGGQVLLLMVLSDRVVP